MIQVTDVFPSDERSLAKIPVSSRLLVIKMYFFLSSTVCYPINQEPLGLGHTLIHMIDMWKLFHLSIDSQITHFQSIFL